MPLARCYTLEIPLITEGSYFFFCKATPYPILRVDEFKLAFCKMLLVSIFFCCWEGGGEAQAPSADHAETVFPTETNFQLDLESWQEVRVHLEIFGFLLAPSEYERKIRC
jgi:hypothetical protein